MMRFVERTPGNCRDLAPCALALGRKPAGGASSDGGVGDV